MKNKANFASIDFETANHSRVSICAAGLAVFEKGHLTESLYWLVRAPKKYGWLQKDFIECHGLTHLDVLDVPEFPSIAAEFLAQLTRADLVVAHNANFGVGHLCETLDFYDLACPEFDCFCTCQLARRVCPELPDQASTPWRRTLVLSSTTITHKLMPKPLGVCSWR
jgi:DNA polymerase-3 subunit epsilon